MNSDCNQTNTTTDNSIDIGIPSEKKLKRRSSIFRPKELVSPSLNFDTHNATEDYANKLKQEITEWKAFYAKKSQEYIHLKSLTSANKLKDSEDHTMNIASQFKDFPEKVNNFCIQVNTALKMHEHLLNCKKAKMVEMQKLVEETDVILKKKLNFKK